MARPSIRTAARGGLAEFALEEQQALVVEMLRRARGAPVSYAELREAGVELPASVVSELELAGWPIERCRLGRGIAPSVRLDPALDPAAPAGGAADRGAPQRPAAKQLRAERASAPSAADRRAATAPADERLATAAADRRAATAPADERLATAAADRRAATAPADEGLATAAAEERAALGRKPAATVAAEGAWRSGPSPLAPPGGLDPDSSYRVYRSRPWAGLAGGGLGRRRRRWIIPAALALAGCLAAAIGLAAAGAFTGSPPASSHSTRTHASFNHTATTGHIRSHGAIITRRPGNGATGHADSVPRRTTHPSATTATQTSPQAATQTSPQAATQTSPQATTQTSPQATTQTSPGSTQTTPATPVDLASAVALDARGHYLLDAGEYAAAIPLLREAMAATGESTADCLEPTTQACLTYAYALYDLGNALRLEGHPAEAVALLRQRLQIDNQRGIVQAILAQAEQQARSGGGGGT